MAYITSYLKSASYEVKQLDLAANEKLDLRSKLGLAECSRTGSVMLKILFKDEFPVSPEEIHKDLMTPEVKHVSVLPSDFSAEDASSVLRLCSALTERCVNRIKQMNADVVGFHVTWDSTLLSLLTAKMLKEADKDLLIVFGGPDCSRTFRGKLIAHLGFVDVVATGEGEKTFADLLSQRGNSSEILRKVKGCIVNVKGKGVADYGEPELISNLDLLPFPDYTDLRLRSYTGFYALPILTSRGCGYNCTFCVDRAAVWHGTYRERSISNVTKEIIHLHGKYGVKTLYFCDSSLNPTLRRIETLCGGLAKAKEKIGKELTWGGDIRASPLARDTLRRMYEVGCRFLMFGAESASETILRSMGKGVTSSKMAQTIKWAKEAGIWVFTYWIVGYPGETGEDLLRSMRFLVENSSNIDEACIAPCEVGYGSGLYEKKVALKIKFLRSSIHLRQELKNLEKYSKGYKAWSDESASNTPMERLYRRMIFEAVARSLGYPSNWAIWPPMPPIDRLGTDDIPFADEYTIHRIEGMEKGEEIYVVPKSTMEPTKVGPLQLQVLRLSDGSRSVKEISKAIHDTIRTDESQDTTLEECSRILAEMVRREIIRTQV
jgi:magnesium-protoporphyrin IX monomethyl ester (oxidative) cyclase